MRGLGGKRVLISGGTTGIGLATARRFLEEGSRLVIAGLTRTEVDAAVTDLNGLGSVSGVAGDVSCEDDVKHVVH